MPKHTTGPGIALRVLSDSCQQKKIVVKTMMVYRKVRRKEEIKNDINRSGEKR